MYQTESVMHRLKIMYKYLISDKNKSKRGKESRIYTETLYLCSFVLIQIQLQLKPQMKHCCAILTKVFQSNVELQGSGYNNCFSVHLLFDQRQSGNEDDISEGRLRHFQGMEKGATVVIQSVSSPSVGMTEVMCTVSGTAEQVQNLIKLILTYHEMITEPEIN